MPAPNSPGPPRRRCEPAPPAARPEPATASPRRAQGRSPAAAREHWVSLLDETSAAPPPLPPSPVDRDGPTDTERPPPETDTTSWTLRTWTRLGEQPSAHLVQSYGPYPSGWVEYGLTGPHRSAILIGATGKHPTSRTSQAAPSGTPPQSSRPTPSSAPSARACAHADRYRDQVLAAVAPPQPSASDAGPRRFRIRFRLEDGSVGEK